MKQLSAAFIFAFVTSPWACAFTLMASEIQGWEGRELQFHVNPQNCPAQAIAAISSAMSVWNAVPGAYIHLALGSDTTQTPASLKARSTLDNPVIVCDPAFDASNWGSGASAGVVPAQGMIFTSRPIRSGGLVLNVQAGAGADINRYDAGKLSIIIAHEMGHVLGLGHAQDASALMYYNATAKTRLALSDDDADGLNYIYGRNEIWRGDPLLGTCGRIVPPNKNLSALAALLISALFLAPIVAAQLLRTQSRRHARRMRSAIPFLEETSQL